VKTAAALLLLVSGGLYGQPTTRQVAITIDDLPEQAGSCASGAIRGLTSRLLEPFRAERMPVTGFVIGSRCGQELGREGMLEVLSLWLEAGADLGNHTWSHPDLNRTRLGDYEADIVRNEGILRPALASRGRRLRYFRHPMLHAGRDLGTKLALEKFLAQRGYRVAPVTLDNSDWMFAYVYGQAKKRGDAAMLREVMDAYLPYMESIFAFFERRSVEVVGREIPQVLLLHASELNAEAMPALLEMMRTRGYSFITLERALADAAYRLPDRYAGPGGFSWIHRWSITKGMKPQGEPNEPEFIAQEYQKNRAAK
jgi:peptidoglycan/xylan/chitin deacetylase (PgdA/CDA1 family)